jgi:UDP-2,4-diacetamido-2,4,6-trideoxy-beta-L-altropyranose hydrolase
MLFVFRADASRVIGTGHVRRCLTLADSLKSQGSQCFFVTREHEGHLAELIRDRGFEAMGLPLEQVAAPALGDYGHWLGGAWEEDADATVAAFAGRRPDWVIVDHYAIDERWERRVRPHCHLLAVIDDLANRKHDCDLLLDQNAVAGAAERYIGRVPAACHLMLGPRYALLQRQYADFHASARPKGAEIRRVLVYFGGADAKNLTGLAVDALLALDRPDIAVDVVVEPAHDHARSLVERLAGRANFSVHGRLPTLAPLMMAADLAVGAGGATAWERCCLGLPALVITLAENQNPIARELDRLGALRWLGHQGEMDAEALRQALVEVICTGSAEAWSRRALLLVDGEGTARVTEMLLLSAGTFLRARRAQASDEVLLLRWANDPVVRRNSFNQDVISPEQHHRWFQRRLASEACRIYMLETESGIPIGQVRFELEDERWVVDYSLASCFRGRGLGRAVLSAALSALTGEMGRISVMARVKVGNRPSCRVFESLSFIHKDSEASGGVHHFYTGL